MSAVNSVSSNQPTQPLGSISSSVSNASSPDETYPTDSEGSEESLDSDEEISWDWLSTEEALRRRPARPRNNTETPSKNTPRSPQKNLPPPPRKIGATGEWEYYEYIPSFTDPDYQDDFEYDITESANPIVIPPFADPDHQSEFEYPETEQKVRRRGRFDVVARIRPAMLPQDAPRNPTEYARRYGINPSWHGSIGRSMISPTSATTRTIMYNNKEYTGMDALNIAQRAAAQGVDVTDMLEGDERHIYLQIMESIEDDKDLQRYLFRNVTTDELIGCNAHTMSNDVPDCNLEGELHPWVRRERWCQALDRGDRPDNPRYLYNVGNHRGEWTAREDFIWGILQPSLQIVSRLIWLEHPAWMGLMNLYTRRHIEPWRDRRSGRERMEAAYRSAWGIREPNPLLPSLQALKDRGFDPTTMTKFLLQDKLQFSIASAYRDYNFGLRNAHAAYGVTGFVKGPNATMANTNIGISVAADVMWSLINPSLSRSEQATGAFHVAAIILHELAHAVTFAHDMMMSEPENLTAVDAFFREPTNCLALRNAGLDLCEDPTWSDPFFANEQEVEPGWAYENQLWGGVVDPGLLMSHAHNLNIESYANYWLFLDQWPHSKTDTRSLRDGTRLRDPATGPDAHGWPLPIDVFARLFTREFWQTEWRKFSFSSLKAWPTGRRKGMGCYDKYLNRREIRRVFGQPVMEWIILLLKQMARHRHYIMMDYLNAILYEKIGFSPNYFRWVHETRTWNYRNQEMETKFRAALAVGTVTIPQTYQEYVTAQRTPTSTPAQNELNGKLARLYLTFVNACEEVHRLLSVEIAYTEHMLFDYMRQDDASRKALHDQWGTEFNRRIVNMGHQLERVIGGLIAAQGQLNPQGREQTGIGRVMDKLVLDRRQLQYCEDLLNARITYRNSAEWKARLSTVATAAHKPRSQQLRKMAHREFICMEPAARLAVENFIKLIDKSTVEQWLPPTQEHNMEQITSTRLPAWSLTDESVPLTQQQHKQQRGFVGQMEAAYEHQKQMGAERAESSLFMWTTTGKRARDEIERADRDAMDTDPDLAAPLPKRVEGDLGQPLQPAHYLFNAGSGVFQRPQQPGAGGAQPAAAVAPREPNPFTTYATGQPQAFPSTPRSADFTFAFGAPAAAWAQGKAQQRERAATGPFPNPYSVGSTVTADVRAAGHEVAPMRFTFGVAPALQGLGYSRRQAAEAAQRSQQVRAVAAARRNAAAADTLDRLIAIATTQAPDDAAATMRLVAQVQAGMLPVPGGAGGGGGVTSGLAMGRLAGASPGQSGGEG